jgi:hypothetical protein
MSSTYSRIISEIYRTADRAGIEVNVDPLMHLGVQQVEVGYYDRRLGTYVSVRVSVDPSDYEDGKVEIKQLNPGR